MLENIKKTSLRILDIIVFILFSFAIISMVGMGIYYYTSLSISKHFLEFITLTFIGTMFINILLMINTQFQLHKLVMRTTK